jgi:hypothetical protein
MNAKVITREEFLTSIDERGENLNNFKVGNMRYSGNDGRLLLCPCADVNLKRILADDSIIIKFYE